MLFAFGVDFGDMQSPIYRDRSFKVPLFDQQSRSQDQAVGSNKNRTRYFVL